jgi:hypothetical protein
LRELVVLAGRAGFGLLPLVIHQLFTAQLAQEGIQSPLLGRELGRAQEFQHVGDIDLVPGHDLEDHEFEQALADRREFFGDVHGFRQLPWARKVLELTMAVNRGC